MRRAFLIGSILALSGAAPGAQAQQAAIDPALLVGTWRLTAIYDEFEDGRRRETWGANPVGLMIYTANGIVSVQQMAGDRQPRPNTVPTDPVGPLVTYYGTYTVEGRVVVARMTQSSWPQWSGATFRRTIQELTPTRMRIVTDPIRDPQGGMFRPHLELERIN